MKSHQMRKLASPQLVNVVKQAVVVEEMIIKADGGARPKEMPDKRILAIKLKTKKNIQSAVSEIRPENIGVAPKKKNITLNVSEKVRIQQSL